MDILTKPYRAEDLARRIRASVAEAKETKRVPA